MALNNAQRRLPGNSKAAVPSPGDERQFRFLRYSHIFASVVREVLEAKFLKEVTPHSLTLLQFHLLKLISLNGDHQVGEIASFLGVSAPAATKNIDKLERLGLVARTPSKGDRRATLLSASNRGRRLVQKYENLKANRLEPVLQEFEHDELNEFSQLLERFSMRLLKHEESADDLCLRCSAYCDDNCPVAKVRGGCLYQKVRGTHANEGAA